MFVKALSFFGKRNRSSAKAEVATEAANAPVDEPMPTNTLPDQIDIEEPVGSDEPMPTNPLLIRETIEELVGSDEPIYILSDQDYMEEPVGSELPWTFEVCWKTFCFSNTKAEKCVLIAPYQEKTVDKQIDYYDFPLDSSLGAAVKVIRDMGINVITGKWKTDGSPRAILFDLDSPPCPVIKNYYIKQMKDHNIDIPDYDCSANYALIFGYLVAEFLHQFKYKTPANVDGTQNIIAQFHDWQCALGLIMLHLWQTPIFTIFTLHTSQVKKDCTAEEADEKARRGDIYHRLCIERTAAQMTDFFVTVTYIFTKKAEKILQRKPDLVILSSRFFDSSHHFFEHDNLSNSWKRCCLECNYCSPICCFLCSLFCFNVTLVLSGL